MAREKKEKKVLTEEEKNKQREERFERLARNTEKWEKGYRVFTDRVTAYLIDLLIVIFLSSMLAASSVTNPFYNNVNESYNDFKTTYNETYDKYSENGITSEESRELVDKVGPKYRTYFIRSKFAMFLWYIVLYVFYFGVFAYMNNGQTIGKKMYRLKVVDNGNNHKPKLKKMLLRCMFGGMSVICGTNLAVVLHLVNMGLVKSPLVFMLLSIFITIAGYILDAIFVLLYVFKKNHRTLDDLVAGTKVVSVPKKSVSKEI